MKNKLPEGWKEVELGEVLDYEQPTDYIVGSEDYSDEYKTPVLTAGKSFILGYTDETKGIYNKLPVIIFDDFTTASHYVDFPFKVKSSAMKFLTPKNKEVNLKYIFWLMQTIKVNSESHKRYYLSKFQYLKIPLPPISIQQKIVFILEKAENAKEWRKEADKLTKDFLKSLFLEIFEKEKFNEKKLIEVTDFIDYRGKTPTKTNSGIPLITAKNVKLGYISVEPREFIAEKDYLSWMKRGFPKEGDILFTTEAPLGNVARLGKFDKIALAQRIITLQCKKELNSYYLMFALLSPRIKAGIMQQSTGSTATGIRAKEFKQIRIPVPPIELQNKFASIVKEVEHMKEQQKHSKDQIYNLFNALMQKAFSGELVG